MIGIGLAGFTLSAVFLGDTFAGWAGMVISAGVFMAGVFKETKGTY